MSSGNLSNKHRQKLENIEKHAVSMQLSQIVFAEFNSPPQAIKSKMAFLMRPLNVFLSVYKLYKQILLTWKELINVTADGDTI